MSLENAAEALTVWNTRRRDLLKPFRSAVIHGVRDNALGYGFGPHAWR